MGQTCNCDYLSKVDESTMESLPKINHKIQFKFSLDDEDIFVSPVSMSTIGKTPNIDPLSLVQSVEDDIYKPSIPITSTNNCQMYNPNEPGVISVNGTFQISDQHPKTLTPSEDEHETNGKDEGETEDLDNITKPNLFREDTKATWDFSDMEDLENDMKQELQSIHFHTVVGDQVSKTFPFDVLPLLIWSNI